MVPTFEFLDLATEDGVELPSGLWEPEGAPGPKIDAWLLFSGTQAPFFQKVQRPWIYDLVGAGYTVLTPNPRGRDLIWRNRSDGRLMGFAFERVSECVFDIRAGIAELRRRGHERIGYFGHSLGAVKGFYYLSEVADHGLSAFVAISPPRSGYSRFAEGPRSDEFHTNLERARQLSAEGHGQDPVLFSHPQGPTYYAPDTFIDRYGDDRYDTLDRAPRITVPMIMTRGSEEREIMPDGYLEQLQGLAVNSDPCVAVTVDGADHFYMNGQHRGAVDAILRWIPTLP